MPGNMKPNAQDNKCLDSSCTLDICIKFSEFVQVVLLVFKTRQFIFHYSCLDLGHLIYCSVLHFSFAHYF
jgi:hypothetical protein